MLWTPLLIILVKVVVIFVLGLVGTMLMVWFERKIVSGMQNRVGPNKAGPFGILQTLADGIKLFFKEDLLPNRADRIVFRLAPFLAFVPAFLVWAVIPLGGDFSRRQRTVNDGTVTIFGQITPSAARRPADRHSARARAVSSIAVYGIMLAGWASRLEVSAARFGPRLGADDLLRGGARSQPRRRAAVVADAVDRRHRAGPGPLRRLERHHDRASCRSSCSSWRPPPN